VSPRAEQEAAMDDVSDYAQRFAPIPCSLPDPRPPVDLLPMHLAACVVPRRNLIAEFHALPLAELLVEAEAMLVRQDRAGRPTDCAILAALIRRVQGKPAHLEGMLMLDFGSRA
jgi:hypothetical protein